MYYFKKLLGILLITEKKNHIYKAKDKIPYMWNLKKKKKVQINLYTEKKNRSTDLENKFPLMVTKGEEEEDKLGVWT